MVMQNIKDGLDGRPVRWYNEVFDLAFHNLDKERAAGLWKKQLEEAKKRGKKTMREMEEHEEDED